MDELNLKEFSTERRKQLAKKGFALPDGSYPIENIQDLKNAIRAFGRAPEGKRAQVKRHIIKRAKALGATNLLPDDWKKNLMTVEKYLALENAQIDRTVEIMLSAKDVGPKARHKLRFLIRFYMRKPHPFTSCVRDNIKRFGKERAERICAVLKDIGTGTTKWRKGRQGAFAETLFSESPPPVIDDEVADLLVKISKDEKLRKNLIKSYL